MPQLPTVAETLPGVEVSAWYGVLAPAGTPREIIAKLNAETVKAIRLPATQERLMKTGVAQMILTPAEFDARIRAEIAANGADLVFEEGAQRLDQLELQVFGKTTHVVVRLDVRGARSAA